MDFNPLRMTKTKSPTHSRDSFYLSPVKNTFLLLLCLFSAGYGSQAATGRAVGVPVRSVVFRTYSDRPDRTQGLKDELAYYRRMQATGAGLTVLGAALFVGGQAMLWTSVGQNESGTRHYTPIPRDPLWLGGLGSTLLSAVPFAFGAPLLKYGTKKVRELRRPKQHPALLQ
jgi:hypothetical protein